MKLIACKWTNQGERNVERPVRAQSPNAATTVVANASAIDRKNDRSRSSAGSVDVWTTVAIAPPDAFPRSQGEGVPKAGAGQETGRRTTRMQVAARSFLACLAHRVINRSRSRPPAFDEVHQKSRAPL